MSEIIKKPSDITSKTIEIREPSGFIEKAVSAVTESSITSKSSMKSKSDIKSKTSYSFMQNRMTYNIIVDDVVMTPENIVDPSYATMEDPFSHAAFDTRTAAARYKEKEIDKERAESFISDLGMKVYATTINLDDIHIDHTISTDVGYPPEDTDLEQAPSAFCFPKLKIPMDYEPNLLVILKETDTQFLFSLPSFSCEKGTQEANEIEEANEYYNYITVGKGRNRKMVNEETQTQRKVTQNRHTVADRPKKKNAMSFASVWDMLDTYAQAAIQEEKEEPDEMVMYQSAGSHLLRKRKEKKEKKKSLTFEDLETMPEFYDAAMLAMRVLAAKDYDLAQKKFRGLIKVDPLSLDLVYIYTLQELWVFECQEAIGRPILSISFNPKNSNILAVAHGKFGYAEQHEGLICVWNTKNPCQPERVYRFKIPVTSVAFSLIHPSWLACGFDNGDVFILDVTSYQIKYVAQSKRDTNPCFEPIWKTDWCQSERGEYLMTACQDGRINRFITTKTNDFICSPMMRISSVEGKLKGMENTRTCMKVDVPISRYPAALCIKWHNHVPHHYYVGTDQGAVHKCSTHYLNQHIDVFRAHAGPVYSIQYSPFMSNLVVTAGADNAVRIWIEDIDDVIMTLNCPAACYDVAFSPGNSTILLVISGNILSIWDLRRKTHKPCAEYTFPAHVVLTYIKCEAGNNVFVGDTTGRIHTFHLEDTPIPPYFQKKMLDEAIRMALCNRPNLLKEMEKIAKFKEKAK